jgi:hypothetical protein
MVMTNIQIWRLWVIGFLNYLLGDKLLEVKTPVTLTFDPVTSQAIGFIFWSWLTSMANKKTVGFRIIKLFRRQGKTDWRQYGPVTEKRWDHLTVNGTKENNRVHSVTFEYLNKGQMPLSLKIENNKRNGPLFQSYWTGRQQDGQADSSISLPLTTVLCGGIKR